MERRSFLSLSALSAVPAVARAADLEHEDNWWGTINNDALSFKAVSEEGNLALQVELIRVPEEEMTEVLDEDGNHLHYLCKGKPMPYPFHPGTTLLTRFDLTWDGKAMDIPERFWNDLFLFPIINQQSSIINHQSPPSPPRAAPSSSNGIAPRNATPAPPSAGSSANQGRCSGTGTARRMSVET